MRTRHDHSRKLNFICHTSTCGRDPGAQRVARRREIQTRLSTPQPLLPEAVVVAVKNDSLHLPGSIVAGRGHCATQERCVLDRGGRAVTAAIASARELVETSVGDAAARGGTHALCSALEG
jgi:hypothetical protein